MLSPRQPIVCVLGHVDHGKTSLLDAIRKTSVVTREAGGITQSIGASVVTTKDGKKITFIDTPGHAAFAGMRARGAKVADIAVLVVAADDGAKPQTIEAVKIIKDAGIPYLVVLTKIDLPGANVEMARASLEAQEVFFEKRGGDISSVEVSSKTGVGIDSLLDLICLMAEVNEIKADPDGDLEAIVIETSKGKGGPLASVIVRNGTLEISQEIMAGASWGKVKGLFDFRGLPVKKILPGEPGQILGFTKVPVIGLQVTRANGRLNAIGEATKAGPVMQKDQIPVIVKADNSGSLEAILGVLPPQVYLVVGSVGDVNDSDIFLAKARPGTIIFVFGVKVPPAVAKLAEMEKVKIESFKIIYELIQRIDEIIKSGIKEIMGRAEIIATFPFNNKKVAGVRLTLGKLVKGDKLVLKRDAEELGMVRAVSLRKGKEEVPEAAEGEYGVIFEPQLDFEVGDVLESQANG